MPEIQMTLKAYKSSNFKTWKWEETAYHYLEYNKEEILLLALGWLYFLLQALYLLF